MRSSLALVAKIGGSHPGRELDQMGNRQAELERKVANFAEAEERCGDCSQTASRTKRSCGVACLLRFSTRLTLRGSSLAIPWSLRLRLGGGRAAALRKSCNGYERSGPEMPRCSAPNDASPAPDRERSLNRSVGLDQRTPADSPDVGSEISSKGASVFISANAVSGQFSSTRPGRSETRILPANPIAVLRVEGRTCPVRRSPWDCTDATPSRIDLSAKATSC